MRHNLLGGTSVATDGGKAEAFLPAELDEVVKCLPPFLNRRQASIEVTRHLFPLSRRSLEAWPLPTRRVNGYAIVPTRTLFEMAYAKFDAAAVVMGGRRARNTDQIQDQHAA